MLRIALPALLLLALALAAPGSDDAVARGRDLFHDTQDLEYASCAQCHSLLPPEQEAAKAPYLGPGASLWGTAKRAGWRNMNTYPDVGAAIQPCAKWWQKRKRGFKAADLAALVAFLKTKAPTEALPKRKVEKRPRLMEDPTGGDAAKGQRLTVRYCGGCHADTDDALSFLLRPGKKRADVILRKVRGYDAKRKFKPRGGTMSYYTTDRLSDEDLRHIIAYLGK